MYYFQLYIKQKNRSQVIQNYMRNVEYKKSSLKSFNMFINNLDNKYYDFKSMNN